MLSEQEGRKLLTLARLALESHFGLARPADIGPEVRTPDGVGGVFSTLKLDGELRGCIGYVAAELDLPKAVVRAVVAAATGDARFRSVEAAELSRIRIGISVLTRAVVVENFDDIQVGRDGLVVERHGARGLLLPQVAVERGWDRDRLLAETCLKADLSPDAWKDDDTVVCRFGAVQFDEYSVNKRSDTLT